MAEQGIPDRLARILAYKHDEAASLRRQRSMGAWEALASAAPAPRGFEHAITQRALSGENALICEVKRRSPSAGDINLSRTPGVAARAYERGGAACISVLTDGPSFGGANADLVAVSSAVSLPVLRKDFMIDPVQILESRAIGADAILIIMSAVDDALAKDLEATAGQLGMSVLVEVHDEAELERALQLSSSLIGINNRDLRRFVTDLGATERLAPRVPGDRILISESGIASPSDISRLRRCGARGFLIGESLMRSERPEETVAEFRDAR
jgi:indole-3-glycerol phosphate synthase